MVYVYAFGAVICSAEASSAHCGVALRRYIGVGFVVTIHRNALVVYQLPKCSAVTSLAACVAVAGQAERRTSLASVGALIVVKAVVCTTVIA